MTATENDHRRRILDLLSQGKITVDDADQLLKALGASSLEPKASASEGAGRQSARWIRVTVDKAARDGKPPKQVSIRVPMALVRGGMRLGAIFPHFPHRGTDAVSQHFRDHGVDVDWSKLDLSQLDAVLQNLDETTIDVDKGRAQVRISYE
jgi:SHOCT-like domain